jgi:hypothetical protein
MSSVACSRFCSPGQSVDLVRQQFEKALELKPDHAKAMQALEQLEDR